jgi:hypothetical protein
MAYLQPPLTIISSSNEPPNNNKSSSRHHLRHHNTSITSSSSAVEFFRLPAATWFDEEQNHFVALEERIGDAYDSFNNNHRSSGSLISGLESLITTNTNDTKDEEDIPEFELVRYQAFGLPRSNNDGIAEGEDYLNGSERSEGSDLDASHRVNNLSAFESAAKKAANERKHKSLVTEIAVSFYLPASLANIESREEQSTSGNTDNTTDDDTTVMLTRRIPVLAKFSPMVNDNVRYLALQYTPT